MKGQIVKINTVVAWVSVALLLGAGCGEHHDHAHSETSYLEEACEHMGSGPATVLLASANVDEPTDTQASDWAHRRVDVQLPEGEAGDEGFLTYEVAQTALYAVFTASAVTVTIDGAQPLSVAPFDDCESIGAIHTFDLDVGEHVVGVISQEMTAQLVVEMIADSEHGH